MTDISRIDYWAWFGRIAAAIGALWAVVQLVNYFSRSEYDCLATGKLSLYALPPTQVRATSEYDRVVDLLEDRGICAAPFNEDRFIYDLDMYAIRQANGTVEPIPPRRRPYNLPTDVYCRVALENTGNRPLEQCSLKLRFGGEYVITTDDSLRAGTSDTAVPIGDIVPGQLVNVELWLAGIDDENHDWFTEGALLAHRNGTCKVRFYRWTPPFWHFLSEWNWLTWVAALLVGYQLIIGIRMLLRQFKPKAARQTGSLKS